MNGVDRLFDRMHQDDICSKRFYRPLEKWGRFIHACKNIRGNKAVEKLLALEEKRKIVKTIKENVIVLFGSAVDSVWLAITTWTLSMYGFKEKLR